MQVYATLYPRGVVPNLSQFNALMEQYAVRFRLGDVVTLLTEMTAAGIAPNSNTFRILLLACQRADQAELAFELYHIMKAKKMQLKEVGTHNGLFGL